MDEKELFIEYESLAVDQKLSYKHQAQRLMDRAPFIHQEICSLILMSKGKFPYKVMPAHLGDVLSTNKIRNHIQSLKVFKHRRIRLLFFLGKSTKKRRVIWAETFWFFWKSARVLAPRIKMVLYHMDEKWFYAVVTRSKDNIVTSIGLEGEDHFVQHKNHIGEEMYICHQWI